MSVSPITSAFDVTEGAFDALVARGFRIDTRTLSSALPPRTVTPSQLRAVLLHPSTTWKVRDEVWRGVIAKSRCDADWTIVALGLLRAGLRQTAGALLSRFPDREREDLVADVVCGVLDAMASIDLTKSKLASKLLTAAIDRVRSAASTSDLGERPAIAELEDGEPSHPEIALWRAVGEGVINAQDAELIAGTRLDNETEADIALRYGITRNGVLRRRARAELRLRDWLQGTL